MCDGALGCPNYKLSQCIFFYLTSSQISSCDRIVDTVMCLQCINGYVIKFNFWMRYSFLPWLGNEFKTPAPKVIDVPLDNLASAAL